MDSRQYEDEYFLNNQFNYGDKSRLATRLGVSVSEVSQQCNPNEPRKSDFHKYARFLRAVREEFGAEKCAGLQAYLNAIADAPGDCLVDLPAITSDLVQEVAELAGAVLTNQSPRVQAKEMNDVLIKATLGCAVLDVNRKADRIASAQPEQRKVRKVG